MRASDLKLRLLISMRSVENKFLWQQTYSRHLGKREARTICVCLLFRLFAVSSLPWTALWKVQRHALGFILLCVLLLFFMVWVGFYDMGSCYITQGCSKLLYRPALSRAHNHPSVSATQVLGLLICTTITDSLAKYYRFEKKVRKRTLLFGLERQLSMQNKCV